MEIFSGNIDPECIAFDLLEDRSDPDNDVIHLGEQILEDLGQQNHKANLQDLKSQISKITVQFDPSFPTYIANCCTIKSSSHTKAQTSLSLAPEISNYSEKAEKPQQFHSSRSTTSSTNPPPPLEEMLPNITPIPGIASINPSSCSHYGVKSLPTSNSPSPKNMSMLGHDDPDAEMLITNISNLSMSLFPDDHDHFTPVKRNHSTNVPSNHPQLSPTSAASSAVNAVSGAEGYRKSPAFNQALFAPFLVNTTDNVDLSGRG